MASFSRLKETYFAHKVHFLNTAKGGAAAQQVAASITDLDLCRHLVEDGHDVGAACRDFGATALHYAALNKEHGKQLVAYFDSLGLRQRYFLKILILFFYSRWLRSCWNSATTTLRRVEKTLLHFFVVENNLAFAKAVHENDGYLIKELKRNGKSALHLAAEYANQEMFEWLVEQGLDPLLSCLGWRTNVLHFAAFNNLHGREIIRDFGATALHYAALNKEHGKQLVAYFVSLGLRVDERDNEEEEPIHYALRVDNFQELLEFRHDDAEKVGKNLLHFFVVENSLAFAEAVHENDGYLIKELKRNGKSALHLAAEYANLEMCQWVVEQGLDPLLSCLGWSSNGLHFAAFNKLHDREKN
ncbi:Hypothetical predicted protein [Cloeon dipterum]|uniref:Uncharacterized protein n=1 Tax=Cloeon dipterum TaxID=197152 RepID=A0A8S1DU15_9INSE|nr:Hypothetical predicted protein [Cloeon dipterum]